MADAAFGQAPQRQAITHRYIVFCFLILLVGITGGSSRPDAVQLLLLRPASVILLGYALWFWRKDNLATLRFPLILLLILAGWITIQLMPLPPASWARLPGRGIAVQTATLAGLETSWYPISMAPARSWNTLISLILPIAALIMAGSMSSFERRMLMLPLLIIGLVSMVLSLIQRLGPPNSLFYFYAITNAGAAVGLFANRNHQAMLLAALVPVMAVFVLRSIPQALPRLIALLIGLLILFVGVIVTSSRGGAILYAFSVMMTFCLTSNEIALSYSQVSGRQIRRSTIVLASFGIAIVAALPILILRADVMVRLAAMVTREFRLDALPIYYRMITDSFPVGIGYGAFERVFQVSEPFVRLDSAYLNHAHNDLAEWIIEGGAVAVVILLCFLLWWLLAGLAAVNHASGGGDATALAGWAMAAVLLIGSLIDYPIRTPIGMVVMAMACAWISASKRS